MFWRGDPLQRGFTLLEMMVALAIIAIGMLAIFRLQAQTVALAQAERFYTVAPLLAQELLSELRLTERSGLHETAGQFEAPYRDYTWQTTLERFPQPFRSAPAEDTAWPAERLLRLEVVIAAPALDISYTLHSAWLFD